ncbi:hypothetical protein BaRGS_00029466 [Batillaria attramentaria]|uniref:4-hydroxy-2-oxoglutarate aldolase, mitochondrial n=1 Tax=Batillaria attramentaria TaxID=370345 RepID=A0ABD0JXG9_9CAEN
MMAAYVTLLIAPLLLATAKSELLFLDVTTNAQLGRVKAAFKGLNVVHSAKFVGAPRYLFVVTYDGADPPRDINLPADASVASYSVTTLSTYFSYFGVETPPQDGFPELPDDNLYFVERSTDYTGEIDVMLTGCRYSFRRSDVPLSAAQKYTESVALPAHAGLSCSRWVVLTDDGPSSFVTRSSSLDVSGIFPPIPTPFNADESIAYDQLESNISKWNSIPLKGYVVQGSNGEYAFLTSEERVELVRRVREMTPKNKLLIAGSGCESTKQTIEMTEKMAAAGAQAVMVVTPCYYKTSMTNEAMITHYTKVADASPVPVILYSVPGNTGLDLSPQVVVQLASHPNIIGLKESGGDVAKIGWIAFKTRSLGFQILAGSAGFLLPAYTVGSVGAVCALANVLGKEVCQLEALYKKGDLEAAEVLQQKLVGPNTCVTKRFGVPGLKAAMDQLGYHGGRTRLPMLPLSESDVAIVRQVFRESGYM